jgi:hypothetical protein
MHGSERSPIGTLGLPDKRRGPRRHDTAIAQPLLGRASSLFGLSRCERSWAIGNSTAATQQADSMSSCGPSADGRVPYERATVVELCDDHPQPARHRAHLDAYTRPHDHRPSPLQSVSQHHPPAARHGETPVVSVSVYSAAAIAVIAVSPERRIPEPDVASPCAPGDAPCVSDDKAYGLHRHRWSSSRATSFGAVPSTPRADDLRYVIAGPKALSRRLPSLLNGSLDPGEAVLDLGA